MNNSNLNQYALLGAIGTTAGYFYPVKKIPRNGKEFSSGGPHVAYKVKTLELKPNYFGKARNGLLGLVLGLTTAKLYNYLKNKKTAEK